MSTPSTPPAVPAWRQNLEQTGERLRAWWSQREPRERKLLQIGGTAVALALIWIIGIKPALSTIEQTAQRLPQLQATALKVDAVIREAQALRRGQSGSIPAAELTPALQSSLQRAGLSELATLREAEAGFDGARQWEVMVDNASAGRVIEWLADVPALLHVQVRSLDLSRTRIDGRDRPGSVSGKIILAAPQENA
ncbi:type II secretion system protein GspM [Kerstersia similis]|uniref:type II secretion system protein GspM n=1 Tax=Kerstersia similis TaxID=206505 RepID=UPI0039F063A2